MGVSLTEENLRMLLNQINPDEVTEKFSGFLKEVSEGKYTDITDITKYYSRLYPDFNVILEDYSEQDFRLCFENKDTKLQTGITINLKGI